MVLWVSWSKSGDAEQVGAHKDERGLAIAIPCARIRAGVHEGASFPLMGSGDAVSPSLRPFLFGRV
jgi:hypothetical protein